jgi:hypothetical protein
MPSEQRKQGRLPVRAYFLLRQFVSLNEECCRMHGIPAFRYWLLTLPRGPFLGDNPKRNDSS